MPISLLSGLDRRPLSRSGHRKRSQNPGDARFFPEPASGADPLPPARTHRPQNGVRKGRSGRSNAPQRRSGGTAPRSRPNSGLIRARSTPKMPPYVEPIRASRGVGALPAMPGSGAPPSRPRKVPSPLLSLYHRTSARVQREIASPAHGDARATIRKRLACDAMGRKGAPLSECPHFSSAT